MNWIKISDVAQGPWFRPPFSFFFSRRPSTKSTGVLKWISKRTMSSFVI